MSRDFYMVPIFVKTTGVWGPSSHKFIKVDQPAKRPKRSKPHGSSCKTFQWRYNVEIVQGSYVQ